MTFENGDKVRVKKYKLYTYGRIGIVTHATSKKVDVLIDGFGNYSYSPSSLELVVKNYNKNYNDIDNKGEKLCY